MNKKVANTVILCVAAMALLLGLFVNRILSPTVMSNQQLNENGLFVYDIPRNIEDFSLIDQHGQPFTNDWFEGKWSVIFFGYTFCPDICPITLATIRQFDQLLQETEAADALQVAMVSVDPERDTSEKLRDYMGFFGEDYVGATGEYIDIFNLARQMNVAFGYQPSGEEGEYLVSHSGEILLVNPNGDFHAFFKVPHDPEKMARNFRSVFSTWR